MADIDVLDVSFTFTRRPSDLAADLRPNWRIPVLLLMLRRCCRGGKSSLFRLHVLNWSLRTGDSRQLLLNLLNAEQPDYAGLSFHVEPSFVRAMQFAVADKLVDRVRGDRVSLSSTGLELVGKIEGDSGVLVREKAFLANVGFRLTESWITAYSNWGKRNS